MGLWGRVITYQYAPTLWTAVGSIERDLENWGYYLTKLIGGSFQIIMISPLHINIVIPRYDILH